MECSVAGIPLPDVRWEFNNQMLEDSPDNQLRIVAISDGQTSRVEVSSATVEFNGVYRCIVSNDAGSVNQSIRIELRRKSYQISI